MTLTRQISGIVGIALAALLSVVGLVSSHADAREKPFNRIVIGVDASGSYKGRQAEALEKAKALLKDLSNRRVRRWEYADEVILVSLDAMPEVIWRGDTKALQQADETVWLSQFRGRSDYTKCTDVAAFFALAAELFAAAPLPTERYLVVFSDLLAEPPLNSPAQCQRPVPAAELAQAIPWEALAEVSTTVFWVPVTQKLAWSRIVQERGLGAKFQLYTESESTGKPLTAPNPAKRKRSEAQQAETRTAATSFLLGFVVLVGTMVVLVAGALVAMAMMARRREGRRHNAGVPRRVASSRHPQPVPSRPNGGR